MYLNSPKGVEMVQKYLDSSSSSNVQYCIEMSILVKNLYPEHLLGISWIIGRGYCLCLTTVFNYLESLTQQTLPSFLGVIKVGEDHSLDPCGLNSLTAIDGHDHQYFNELRSTVVSCRIFIRSQSLIARWTRNDFSSPAVSRNFYEAFLIDDVSKGSKSYLFCAS